MLFLQILATFTLISLLRRRRQLSEKTEEWHFIRQHPWAFSIFVVQALVLLLYPGPAPSLDAPQPCPGRLFILVSDFRHAPPSEDATRGLLAGRGPDDLVHPEADFVSGTSLQPFSGAHLRVGNRVFCSRSETLSCRTGREAGSFLVGLRGGPLVFFAVPAPPAGRLQQSGTLPGALFHHLDILHHYQFSAAPHRQRAVSRCFSGSPQWPVWGWSAGSGRPSKAG